MILIQWSFYAKLNCWGSSAIPDKMCQIKLDLNIPHSADLNRSKSSDLIKYEYTLIYTLKHIFLNLDINLLDSGKEVPLNIDSSIQFF